MIILGLMSGTSMDGLDCCLAKISIKKNKLDFEIIKSTTFNYTAQTRKLLLESVFDKKYNKNFLDEYLGEVYSGFIEIFLNSERVDLIANHGQTISHKDKVYSYQICSPSILFNSFKIPVAYNFRSNDIKVGGNGAPLMPLLDWYLFNEENVITINVGGISNLSIVFSNKNKNSVIGFDTGPGMCLIDLYVKKYWSIEFDFNGELASNGEVNKILLNYLMNRKFIKQKYPKSASTEMYDHKYLTKIESKFSNINSYDFLRTLVNFTAESISENLEKVVNLSELQNYKILASGGGVKNKVLLNDLNKNLSDKVELLNYMNLNIDNKESFLMCLMGYTCFKKINNNMPSVTGAKKSVVCGEIYE